MATFREIQANFKANAQSLKRTLRGIKSEMGSMKSETEKTSNASQKAYGRMADGTKVYRDAQGRLQTELGKTVTASQVAAREGSRTEKVWHNISSGLDTASRGVQSFSDNLQGIGNGLVSFGGSLTRNVTMPLAGLATALAGTALVKGFNRLVGIDTARAKLTALGHDGEAVEGIMNSANESVLGTSFGLDEAATIAASAVAAGVETGSELTSYLTTTGDAAAIAGTSLDEMGNIFNKVQTSGKAYNRELQMLSERGLPIYTWLAEEANTTEDAIFDMASQGEISTEMFLSAIENNIGGAAAVMGEESFTAALANMWAAVSRLGASFLEGGEKGEGFFNQLKPILGELTEGFDNMGDVAAVWGEKFGQAFATFIDWIRRTIEWFRKQETWFQVLVAAFGVFMTALGPVLLILGKLILGISAVGSAIAPVLGWLSRLTGSVSNAGGLMSWLGGGLKILASRFSFLLGPVGIVIGVITTLAGVFMYAYRNSESFRNFIGNLGSMFVDAWQSVKQFADNVKTAFEGIFAFFQGDLEGGIDLLRSLGLSDETIETIYNATARIRRTFERLRSNVMRAIGTIKEFFVEQFQNVKSWWDTDGEMILSAISTSFEFAFDLIKAIVDIALKTVINLFQTFAPIIQGIWNLVWPVIVSVARTAWETIKLVIGTAMDVIMGVISAVSALIEGDWSRFGEVLKDTALSIWNRVVEFFWNMMDNALELINNLTGGGIDKFIELRDGVIQWVSNLYHGVIEWFRNLWTGTTETTTNIKDGVVNRIVEMYNSVVQWVSNLYNSVTQWFRNMASNVIERVWNMIQPVVQPFIDIYNYVKPTLEQMRTTISEIFSRIYQIIRSAVVSVYNIVRDRFLAVYNRVRDIVINLYNTVSKWFLNLYNNLRDRVINIYNNITNRFGNLRDRVVSIVRNLYERVRDWFLSLYNNLRDRVIRIRDYVVSRFTEIRDRVINRVRRLYNSVRDFFWNIYTYIRDKMRDAKNSAVGFAEDLYTGAKKQFDNLVTAARDMMNGIGKWIDNKRSNIVAKAKSLGTGIANAAIDGFNSLIKGINWVAKKLGAPTIDTISRIGGTGGGLRGIAAYSRGTKNHPGGPALVGDKGYGNTIGGGSSTREIVELPNGRNFLMDGDIFLPNAPRGMNVHSNRDTEAILASNPDLTGGSGTDTWKGRVGNWLGNAVGTGTGKALNTKNEVTKAVATGTAKATTTAVKAGQFAKDIWDYATNPAELVRELISKYANFDLPKYPLEFVTSGVSWLSGKIRDKFKEWFEKAESTGDGSHILGKRILQTFGRYTGGIGFNGGRHYGIDTAHKFDPLISPVNGKVTRVWRDFGGGNSLQVTSGKDVWWFMHLSNIIKKVGDTVRAGMRLGTTGNSGNWVVGSGHLHTQLMRGGIGNAFAVNPLPVLKNLKGYFKGGITSGMPELAWLNEEGFRESIISHNPAHRERSESIWTQTGDKLGFNNRAEELSLLREQNKILADILSTESQHADISHGILNKPTITSRDIYENYNEVDRREIGKRSKTTGRMRY